MFTLLTLEKLVSAESRLTQWPLTLVSVSTLLQLGWQLPPGPETPAQPRNPTNSTLSLLNGLSGFFTLVSPFAEYVIFPEISWNTKIIIHDKSLMELRNFTIHTAQRDKDRTENWYSRQKLIHYKPPHYSRPCSWFWVSSHLVCVLMSRGRLAPAPEFEGKLFGFLVASRWSRSRCAGSEAEESDGLVTWTRVHHDTWWHVYHVYSSLVLKNKKNTVPLIKRKLFNLHWAFTGVRNDLWVVLRLCDPDMIHLLLCLLAKMREEWV